MILENIKRIGVASVLAVSMFSSCSDDVMDGINEDKNNPGKVFSRFVITDAIAATAFKVTGSDYAFYASVYTESQVGVFGQMFNAERRITEPYASSTYNNAWGSVYTNIWNLKTVIANCSAGGVEAGNFQALGIAQLLTAYNLALQTDLMGDIPWTEAAQPGVIFQPKLDKQEAIYADVMTFLDNAIVNLGKASTFASIGTQDLLFSGKNEQWIKMAYGLKARYRMRLSLRKPQYQAVIDDVDRSFVSSSEAAGFKFNGNSSKNPFFLFNRDLKGFGASLSLHDKLLARNDPRDGRFFIPAPGKTILEFAPNGNPAQAQGRYGVSGLSDATAPVYLLSYHELLFLKAEAYARLHNDIEAERILKLGIAAAFVKVGLTEVAANNYYAANVKALFDANPVKEIMLQKYLSFYEAESIENYNDYRRLKAMGNDAVSLLNSGEFPLRFTYGSTDVITNNNVKSAYGNGQYVKTENVWWAGGTR